MTIVQSIVAAAALAGGVLLGGVGAAMAGGGTVDTGQVRCYDTRREIPCPPPGAPFHGQDAQYQGPQPAYRDNGDGTVSDRTTGLMWSQGVDSHKVTLEQAEALARELTLGGHHDWRVPTIKELYSLIDFRGDTGFSQGRPGWSERPANAVPFINTDFFDFRYGDSRAGERYIDAQWLSRTRYVSTTMNGAETLFGVNFADGRIKGYGYRRPGRARPHKLFFVRYVRGPAYGENRFEDRGDGTVVDRSSGLQWSRDDSGRGMTWEAALHYAETLTLAGHDDWRLPNAKELQYIVDYTRSPDTTGSAAIDPVFHTTAIQNEAGQRDFPHFWTATTHRDGPHPAAQAAYVAFGRAMGQMFGQAMDVHGAGAQRSDPKQGQPAIGHGPQGDAQRVYNSVRVVRGGAVAVIPGTSQAASPAGHGHYPQTVRLATDAGDGATGQQEMTPAGGRPPAGGPGQGMGRAGWGGGAWGGPPAGGAGFVQRLDRDGDGRVSRAEFDGPPARFDDHDADRDGYLSEQEAPHGPPPHGGGGFR